MRRCGAARQEASENRSLKKPIEHILIGEDENSCFQVYNGKIVCEQAYR
ncbi:MAG: hypothetical protein HQ557_13445 [Bacteroidetes bacterium]|nr:hypothetical protein [Bacteroidota bacterium]